jgi:hypothetical protein
MCEIDFGDGDPVYGFTQRQRKARKEHRCDLCRGAIPSGSTYFYASWIYDHRPDWEHVCAVCAADIEAFSKAHEGFFMADSFLHYLDECIAEGDEESEAWIPMRDRIHARCEETRAQRAALAKAYGVTE